MDISITARHLEISDDLRDYIEEKVTKFERYVDRIIDVKVVLQKQKDRVSADITMQVNDYRLHGQETTHDIYGSIDQVLDKMERQLRKYKEKMHDRRGKHTIRQGAEEVAAEPASDEIIRNTLTIKPMSLDEAIMQMDLLDYSFWVFTNDRSGEMNVIYRRGDGRYGLIEPY